MKIKVAAYLLFLICTGKVHVDSISSLKLSCVNVSTLRIHQKIFINFEKSENIAQSFTMGVYEKLFF